VEPLQSPPIVLLDPYLLLTTSMTLPSGTWALCPWAKFALCGHLTPGDFLPHEYTQITRAQVREQMNLLSVNAIEMEDLLPMLNVLIPYQIATIAVARLYHCLFASDCAIFRRMARVALPGDYVLCGDEVRQRFRLS